MASSYKIGADSGSLVTLDTVINHDPQPSPVHYAKYAGLGDGNTRGIGWLEAEWRWAFIDTSEVAALRAYCTNISGAICIKTVDIDGTFKVYDAIVIWPQMPDTLQDFYFRDFVLRFVELVNLPLST